LVFSDSEAQLRFLGLVLSGALWMAAILPSFRSAKPRSQTTRTMEDLRMIHAAMDQYAIEFKKQPGDPVSWNDVLLYMKEGTKLYNSQNNDLFGNPYSFKEVGVTPKLSPASYSALSDVAPQDFWSPYLETEVVK